MADCGLSKNSPNYIPYKREENPMPVRDRPATGGNPSTNQRIEVTPEMIQRGASYLYEGGVNGEAIPLHYAERLALGVLLAALGQANDLDETKRIMERLVKTPPDPKTGKGKPVAPDGSKDSEGAPRDPNIILPVPKPVGA